jgi:hypothetical protein
LVSVLSAVLGVASLSIAVRGALSGVIDGSSATAARFPFATRPFAFLLIVGVWTILGCLLLYVAWSGRARRAAEAGKGGKADEAPKPRRARPTDPRFHGRTASSFGPVGEPLRPDELARLAPAPERFAARDARAPPPLLLFNSKTWAVFGLIVSTALMAVSATLGASVFASLLGERFAQVLVAAMAFAYLTAVYRIVRNLRWEGPALVLDEEGITDCFRGAPTTPWRDVRGVRLTASSSTTYLVLQFAHAQTAARHFGLLKMPHAFLQRIVYDGFECALPLTSLSFSRVDVTRTAQAFLKHSRLGWQ